MNVSFSFTMSKNLRFFLLITFLFESLKFIDKYENINNQKMNVEKLHLLMIFFGFILCIGASESATVDWNVAFRKKINCTTTTYVNFFTKDHFGRLQLQFLLNGVFSRGEAFLNRHASEFYVMIDLLLPRRITSLIAITDDAYYPKDVHLDGDAICKYKEEKQIHYRDHYFECNEKKAEHIFFYFANDAYAIFDLIVLTKLIFFKEAEMKKLNFVDISHPYATAEETWDVYNQKIAPMEDNNFIKFTDDIPKFIDFGSLIPVMWYTLKYDKPVEINKVVIWSQQAYFPDISLAYRSHDNRNYIDYLENGKIKVFVYHKLPDQSNIHLVGNLLALWIRINILTYYPQLEFKINFLCWDSMHFYSPPVKNIIHSANIITESSLVNVDVSWINLGSPYNVIGIQFDNMEMIEEFCLSYTNEMNVDVKYKDHATLEQPTVFQLEKYFVVLRMFIASRIRIECLHLKYSSDFAVHIHGRKNLDSYEWKRRSYSSNFPYLFTDENYQGGLEGTLPNFYKLLPEEKLESASLGHDCFTYPDICDKGLTVQFQLKGNLEEASNDTFYITPNAIGTANPVKLEFSDGVTLVLEFHHAFQYSYAEIQSCEIYFESNSNVQVSGDFYLTLFTYEKYEITKTKDYPFIIEHLGNNTMKINLTIALREAFLKLQAEARHIHVWLTTTVGDMVGDHISLVMKLKTRIRVPKKIENLVTDRTSITEFKKYKHKIVNGSSVVTKICLYGHFVSSEVTLSYHYSDNEYEVNLLRGEQNFLNSTLLKDNQYACVNFPYPTILDNFIVTTLTEENKLLAHVYGSPLTEASQTETFPIISAGISGDDSLSQGTGFAIYYDTEEYLHALVKTSNNQYHIKFKLNKTDENTIQTITTTWNKTKLSIYVDGQLKLYTSLVRLIQSDSLVEYQNILIFGNRGSIFSYSQGKFKSFKLWRNVFMEEKFSSKFLYTENLLSFPQSFLFHRSMAGCVNIICPTIDSYLEQVIMYQHVGKLSLYENVNDILEETIIKAIDETDKDIEITYTDFFNPYHIAIVESINAEITHLENVDTELKCLIKLKNTDSEQHRVLKGNFNKEGFTSIIEDYLLESNLERLLFTLQFEKDNCIGTGKQIVDVKLIIKYKVPIKDEPSLVSYAHEGYASMIIVDIQEDMMCLKVNYIFSGDGFAYISFIKQSEDGFAEEILRKQLNTGHDNDQEIKLPLDGSENPYKVRVAIIKNGLGRGYFRLLNIKQLNHVGEDMSATQIYDQSGDQSKVQEILQAFGLSSLLRVLILSGKNPFPISQTLNRQTSISNETKMLSFVHGFSFYCFTEELSYQQEVNKEEFAISFWVNCELEETYMTVMIEKALEQIFLSVGCNSTGLVLTIFENEYYYAVGKWKWIPVMMLQQFKFRLEIDQKIIAVDQNIPLGRENFRLIFSVPQSCQFYCLQMYSGYMNFDLKKQMLMCPTRYDLNACDKYLKPNCGWCNQLTGLWTPHQTLDENCDNFAVSMFNPQIHSAMESLEPVDSITGKVFFLKNPSLKVANGVFRNSIENINPDEVTSAQVETFDCDGACVFASWFQYTCNNNETEKVIFMSQFLIIQCSKESSITMRKVEFITNSNKCRWIEIPDGFWVFMAVLIDNGSPSNGIIINDKRLDSQACVSQFSNPGNTKFGIGGNVKIDEMFLVQRTFAHHEFETLYRKYIYGEGLSPFLKMQNTKAIWIEFFSNNVLKKEIVESRGTIANNNMIKDLLEVKATTGESYIDFDSMMTWFDTARNTLIVRVPVYSIGIEETLITELESSLNTYKFSKPEIISAHTSNDLSTMFQEVQNRFSLDIEPGVNEITFHLEEIPMLENMLIHGIHVLITRSVYIINPSLSTRTYPSQIFHQNSFTVKDLEAYSIYIIELRLVVKRDSLIIPTNPFSYIHKNVVTKVGVPNTAPNISCLAHVDMIKCKLFQLDPRFWNDQPFGYEIAKLLTSIKNEKKDGSIFDRSDDIGQQIENFTYVDDKPEFQIEFPTQEIYENFTIEVRAVTDNGNGKGVVRSITMRSIEGAPDYTPKNLSISYKNGMLSLKWEKLPEDVDYWNTDISQKINWNVQLEYRNTSKDKSNFVKLQYDASNYDVAVFPELFVHIIGATILSQNIKYFTAKSETICFILPSDQVPFVGDDWKVSNETHSHTDILLRIHFPRFQWRGIEKYLYIVVIASNENVDDLADDFIRNDILPKTQSKQNGTYHIETDHSYWIRVFRRYHFLNNEIETTVANKSLPCANENVTYISNHLLDIEVISASLTYLHPYTPYKIYTSVCNENGCNKKSFESFTTTKPYIPAAAPQNTSIEPADNFGILLRWRPVDRFYVNNEIKEVTIRYLITRTNKTREFRHDYDKNYYIEENIGKYELVCFQIAAFTDLGIGPYSNMSCNYTHQSTPDVAPDFQIITANSSSFTIEIYKPNDISLINGILTSVTVTYNISWNEYINKSYEIDHEAFIDFNVSLFLVLGNLKPFTSYFLSLAFATIDIGLFSITALNKTRIDNPSYPPSNITLLYNESYLNTKWNNLPSYQWNGPALEYNITLLETLLDGTTSMKFFRVVYPQNYLLIFNLHPYRNHMLNITSCTIVGCSYPHSSVFQTLEYVPCPPNNVSRIESIRNKLCVQWSQIDAECENGILKSYNIFVKQITKQPYAIEKSFSYNVSSSHLKSCVEDIPMGRIYNISVAGSTGAGLGPRSAVLSLVFGVIVNGNWTLWTKWTPCTSSCDNGTRSRQRFCSNPTPVNGLPCQGHNNETKYCILPSCEGEYLAPQGQFDCQTFCEDLGLKCRGYISTKNSTDIFRNLGKTCSSLTEKFKYYEEDFHPSYDNEHNVCAGFIMKSGMVKCKVVNNGAHNHVQRICNCQDPESEGLSEWYSWSPCLDKCNASLTKTRSRSCIPGFQCSKKAKLIDQQTCGLPPCPIDGGWSEWQESTRCSKSCDGGYKVKVRTCTNPPPDHGGDKCRGPSEDEGEVCNAHPCPVHGGWSLWTEWSSCNQPCGTTNQRRERFCNSPKPKYRGADCSSDRQVEKRQTFCDFQVCIELDVSLTLRILNRDWHFTMYQLTSPLAKSLEKDVYENILENRSEITSVKLTKLSRGSVIPTIMLRYKHVNQVQITSLVNQIDRTKMIGDLQIDDYQVYVTLVPYHPPVDISVGIINKTSVNISWRLIDEKFKGKFIYVMYIEKDHSKDVEWNIEGVESSRNFILLYYLKPGQLYEAYLVQSNHFGNGIPSGRFLIQTLISPPSKYPLNVRGYALSSTGIYLSWNPIPEDIQNVQLSGYIVKYKKHNEKHFKSKEIDKNLLSSTLTGLEPYTYYEVDVSGINEGGEGPADYAMIKTLEGVPSVPVPDVKVVDMQTIDWWSVSWSPLPKNKIHGILRGYRLKYYLSYRSDIPIGGEIKWIVKDFDKFTFYHKEKNLLNYATYNLTVTGFTNAGEGPTPEHFAKTCRCKRHLFGQWTILNPYTERSTNSANLTGLFPNLILKAMIKACGSCAKYHQSVLDLYSTKYGSNPMKHSDYELKLNINEDVDVSFPYYERITTQAIVPESIFLPIIKSTGCAFITRDEINLNQLVIDLILNVFKVWPLLIVGYAIAALCGVLIWATDQFMNPDEFKIGSSLRGPCIGFWFSFVTMTTVGYGDLTPRSIAARVLSMLWFLIGLILNGIIVGFITTALTSLDQPETVKLYNTKTAALSKSYEYRFAVRRNANVQDKQYTTIDEMLDDLEDKKVDAVLVDLFSMVGYKEKIKSRYLKVKTILDTQTAYGIILSGQSVHLKNDIETMIFSEQGSLSNFIRSIEDDIPKLSESKLGDVMPLVFGADSATFKETALIMVYILACLLFVGFVFEMIRIMRRRMKVDVAGDEILMKIEHDVELFVNTVTSRIENMVHTQERERIYLHNLIQAVKRYESKVGKVAASIKIDHLWDD